MNQKKIGEFLKELRKEKGLTQEQLAEKFYVSNRTVSRWETGSNLLDISTLIELADFYDCDIREIINGERKSENMTTSSEEKKNLKAVAEYAEEDKATLLKRVRTTSIVGIIAVVLCFIVMVTDDSDHLPVVDFIMGATLGLAFSALLVSFLYTIDILSKVKQSGKLSKKMAAIIITICAIVALGCFIAAIFASV
ncbi:MAG: helix-turn-helix domain-containing protein [Oscillospiraceae bacterium]|nr:helix-turn-helix domain-containing protein [Oscillospiraceae bacterium]